MGECSEPREPISDIKTTSLKSDITYTIWDDITRSMGTTGTKNYWALAGRNEQPEHKETVMEENSTSDNESDSNH